MCHYLSDLRTRFAQLALAGGLCLGAASVDAENFDSLGVLTQGQFEDLMSNLAAATHYKGIAPGETLGVLGADVAAEVSSTSVDGDVFDLAGGGGTDLSDTLLVPRLHAHKGLPFGIDVGAFLGAVADSDITIVGVELRYALIDGGALTPALALRASASRIQGSNDVELDNAALEITVSKGFLPITPYAGAGVVFSRGGTADDIGLDDVSFEQEKVFVGVNVNLGLNFGFEVDVTGGFTTFSAKAGIRF